MYPGGRLEVADFRDRAIQSEKDSTDINSILRRYDATGMISHVARGVPTYMDVSEVGDYRTAMEHLRATESFFMGLPAKVREKFGNDPVEFIDAVSGLQKHDVESWLADEAAELEAKKPVVQVDLANPQGVPRRGPDGRFIEDEPPAGGTR